MRFLLGLALCSTAVAFAGELPGETVRPKHEINLSNPYSTDSVPAYAGDHAAVHAYIDAEIEAHMAALQRWMRQRSISAQNVGVRDMAEMVRGDFEALGFAEAELVNTAGHPGVWGYYDAGAEKTLMVYMMYDVQPVDPEDWRSPPFEAALVDTPQGRAIMARGATNQKGPQRAFLNAVEALLAVDGELPVNLMITAEGEEELGSPNYPEIVDRYEARLKQADGVIFPMSGQDPAGQMSMVLGVKGIVYWELEARGGAWGGPVAAEIHGSLKAIADSPVLRLAQAISSLVGDDGNTIVVPGYYDDVRPPTPEEQSLIAGYLQQANLATLRDMLGVERWIDGMDGVDVMHDLIYTPTMKRRRHLGRLHRRGRQDDPAAHGHGEDGFAPARRHRSRRGPGEDPRPPRRAGFRGCRHERAGRLPRLADFGGHGPRPFRHRRLQALRRDADRQSPRRRQRALLRVHRPAGPADDPLRPRSRARRPCPQRGVRGRIGGQGRGARRDREGLRRSPVRVRGRLTANALAPSGPGPPQKRTVRFRP